MYIMIPKTSKLYKDVKKNYHMVNEEMVDQMIKISQNENVNFYYNPEEWIFFDNLLKEIPLLEKYSKVEFIQKKKKTILEYNNNIYFVNIFDYIVKNGTSPLSFETDKIKSIIKPKIKRFEKKARLDLYDDGVKIISLKNILYEKNNFIDIIKLYYLEGNMSRSY